MYQYILIPGRHHLLTQYMYDYFCDIAKNKNATTIRGESVSFDPQLQLVWAITSSNHSNTRRNPVPNYRREASVEIFMHDIPAGALTYHIPNVGTTNRFADYLLKTISVESRGLTNLTPNNCVVATSTPSVIALFESLGYKILSIELDSLEPLEYRAKTAWEILLELVEAKSYWRDSDAFKSKIHPASRQILEKYDLGSLIVELHQDPLVGEEGDITETRDYEVYRQAFDQGAERKYKLLSRFIEPGRIVDIGCATGALIKQLDNDDRLVESDFFGVEVARPLYEYCLQRRSNGEFKNENIFFYQRNIMRGKLFEDNSINTSISISLTHEIESYLGRDSLHKFMRQVYDQTAPGGVWINLDVIGPENKDEMVWLWVNHEDGQDDDGREFAREESEAYAQYLSGLSTLGRLRRFIKDFRAVELEHIGAEIVERDGKWYGKMRHADAVDFMTTKDYIDSWYSEMHERFCYFAPSEWYAALSEVGFSVDPASGAFQNEWINQHRFDGSVALHRESNGELEWMGYPDTTILLIAKKL